METVSRTQFANNALWKLLDVIVRKLVGMIISILLARIIAPESYGVVALTLVFLSFSDIFILNGFNVALVRKSDVNKIDYSTVMCLSLLFSSILYGLFYVLAPFVAVFYESEELSSVIRVITLLLFFQAIATVVRSKGTRELRFKEMAIAACASGIISGLFAVGMAYMGYGVWALVNQQLLGCFLEMLLLLYIFKWKFSFKYSNKVAIEMLKFTFGVMSTSFLDFLGNNVCNLVIGKTYSTRDLGFYNRANMFPETIGLNVNNSINSVLLPTLSSRQDNDKLIKDVTRRILSFTLFIVTPLLAGLAAIADHFIPLLLTEKWNNCIPMMYFCCAYYAINPIRSIGYSLIYAKGKSHICARIEVIRSVLMITGIFFISIILKLNLMVVLATNLIVSVITVFMTLYQMRRLIGYNFKEFCVDIMPTIFINMIMFIAVYQIGKMPISEMPMLIVQVIVGIIVYALIAIITKNKNFNALNEYLISVSKKAF